jgi:hypothetical protein
MDLAAQAKASMGDLTLFFRGLVDKNLFLRHLINGIAVTAVFVLILGMIPQTRKLMVSLMSVK